MAQIIDISERTLKRWRGIDGLVAEDQRPEAEPVQHPHKLTQIEELAILSACNQPQYRTPPSQIVPSLADKGLYLASESSFYRVLKKTPATESLGTNETTSQGAGADQLHSDRPEPGVELGD